MPIHQLPSLRGFYLSCNDTGQCIMLCSHTDLHRCRDSRKLDVRDLKLILLLAPSAPDVRYLGRYLFLTKFEFCCSQLFSDTPSLFSLPVLFESGVLMPCIFHCKSSREGCDPKTRFIEAGT